MRYFDSHCHLDADYGPQTVHDIILKAQDAGVAAIVLPAVAPDNWEVCLNIAARYPMVHVALGIHPQCVRDLTDPELEQALPALHQLLQESDAVAVGELGIDHRWDTDETARLRQERVFLAQLDIAAELKLPPIIHCLDAQGRFEHLWREHACRHAVHGIMHSFSGSAELVRTYVALNLFISYSGAVTWNGAKRVPRAAAATPDDRLLVETDAPYQPPHPLEDGPNRPDRVARVVEVLAALRQQSPEHIAELTWKNAIRAFQLPAKLPA